MREQREDRKKKNPMGINHAFFCDIQPPIIVQHELLIMEASLHGYEKCEKKAR